MSVNPLSGYHEVTKTNNSSILCFTRIILSNLETYAMGTFGHKVAADLPSKSIVPGNVRMLHRVIYKN